MAGTTTVAPSTRRAHARKPKKIGADYVPAEPWTLRAALQQGDIFTRLSALIWGLSNAVRKQYVKAVLFFAIEIAAIVFIIVGAIPSLAQLPGLGTGKVEKVKDADGFWQTIVPTPSVVLLLYGVSSLVMIVLIAWFWTVMMRSQYKAQYLASTQGHAPTFKEDCEDLLSGRLWLTLMTLPTLGIFTFTVLPLIFMISMAFTSYDAKHPTKFDWVGLQNFGQLFSTTGSTVNFAIFTEVLIWTLVWAFFATFLNFFLGMFLAMVIERPTTRLKGMWRAIFSMSIAVPQFVSLLVMRQMLQQNGAINRLFMQWGWIDQPLPFFTDPTWARVTVIIINLWVGIPFTIMQITGILENIPGELTEAATLDGANWWQRFTNVTMPYIIFVMTPYLITTFTANVNNFNVIYLLSGGDPTPVGSSAGKTDLLITWLYKLTVDKNNYNIGAVIGIFTFIVLAVVSLITYRSSGSYKNEEAFR